MTALEVLLIALGFVFIGLSFFISERKESGNVDGEEYDGKTTPVWSDKDDAIVKQRVEALMEEKAQEIVEQAEDRMIHISNDKIMAVDEFSQQLLDKIEENHKEVVFMYNMLEEKEKELKKNLTEPSKKIISSDAIGMESERRRVNKEKVAQESLKKVTEVPADVIQKTDNKNKEIRELYRSGKTILEISKELNMGQGEVKLVIDLYGEDKTR